jgi:uncharacterized protein (DUF362 family)
MEKNEILVVYGTDISGMAFRLAREANLAELIGDRGKRIGIKPNLVTARPASEGATTHPEIASGLISYLKENGEMLVAGDLFAQDIGLGRRIA